MLYLVDGDGLLYRAANAIPLFTNKRGLPINGLHGFATMMWRLRRTARPSHMAVAFTADPPLLKHAWDPDYKVNHYEHPEEIKQQMPYAIRFVQAMGAQAFLVQGYEADDVIATLLRQSGRHAIRIVSSDRDFYQFVSNRVRVLAPVRGVSEMREIGPAEVVAAFGVGPAQIPDLRALVGDTSDDIPGVRGIGPKIAAALLKHHVTVEGLLDSAAQDGRLAPMRERILLNKRLILPLTVPFKHAPDLRMRRPDEKELQNLALQTQVRGLLAVPAQPRNAPQASR